MSEYPPEGLAQPNLDTHHLAAKVASLVDSKIRSVLEECEGFSFNPPAKEDPAQTNLDTHHLAAKVALLMGS